MSSQFSQNETEEKIQKALDALDVLSQTLEEGYRVQTAVRNELRMRIDSEKTQVIRNKLLKEIKHATS